MREVFGERGDRDSSRASHKTDRSRGCCTAVKPRQNAVNKGRFDNWGCPRRGDRCGDRVKCALTTSFVLEKRFERIHKDTPLHHSTSFPRRIAAAARCRPFRSFTNKCPPGRVWDRLFSGKFYPRMKRIRADLFFICVCLRNLQTGKCFYCLTVISERSKKTASREHK